MVVVARVDGMLIPSTVGEDRVAVVGVASQMRTRKVGRVSQIGCQDHIQRDAEGSGMARPGRAANPFLGGAVAQVSVTGFAG